MSLTEILTRPEVAAQFSKYVRTPHELISCPPVPLVAQCTHQSYALVGTAFDYCMRFCLAAANQGMVSEQTWIAEIALQIIEEEENHLPAGLTLRRARDGLRRARELYEEFLQTRLFTRRLARASLFLAALDRAYREGPQAVVVGYLKEPLVAETEDLMRLVRNIPREIIKAQVRVALNPTFGQASAAVEGADADYVIDDTLVDIKTTKSCQITSSHLHQLVGYRMLLAACEPGGSSAQGEPEITHGAIYFSRHAHLARFSYREVICPEDFKKLGGWLMRKATASLDGTGFTASH